MERVFLRDVVRKDGSIRWKNGQIVDYPKFTWDNIARSLGEPLGGFSELASVAASEHARAIAAATATKDDDEPAAPPADPAPTPAPKDSGAEAVPAPEPEPATVAPDIQPEVVSARTSKPSAPATV